MESFGWNVDRLEGPLAHERFGMFVLPSSFSGSFLAWSLAEQGEFARAIEVAEQAARVAEDGDHPFSRGYAHLGLGIVALRRGHVQEAIRGFERALGGRLRRQPGGLCLRRLPLG